MAAFSEIIGHEQAIAQLQGAIRAGRVAHAYLIEGDPGTGKRLIADAFAQTLQCEKNRDDACGECRSCHQAMGHNHPDIISLMHEKPQLISIDEIRDGIANDIQILPYNGKYKIYIIEDAQKMNPAAQNALLKTLEEPPEYAVIILLTPNAEALLETIRSRCVRIQLKSVPDEKILQYLMEHLHIPDYQARLCLAFARGSIGRAMELASSADFAQIRTTALMITARAKEMDLTGLAQVVKDMGQYKLGIQDFLDILAIWYRDVLYFKATRSADALVFRDQLPRISATARTSSYEGIETILQAIETAKDRLNANVSFDLTLELLFMTIKEN